MAVYLGHNKLPAASGISQRRVPVGVLECTETEVCLPTCLQLAAVRCPLSALSVCPFGVALIEQMAGSMAACGPKGAVFSPRKGVNVWLQWF